MAGAANLHRHSHGQLGRVDDGLAFLEDRGLGQGRVPGTRAVTGFAANPGLDKGVFLDIYPGGVAAAAFGDPGFLIPIGVPFSIRHPAVALNIVLDGGNV